MANSAEQDPDAKHKYEEVEVFKVDIVGGPSTKDKFLTLRSKDEEGGTPMPRRAMTKAAVNALRQNNEGIVSLPVVARQEVVDVVIEQQLLQEEAKDNKTQQSVERTENEPEINSEETEMKAKELEEKLGKLTGRVERMEQAASTGDFSTILGTAGTPEEEEDSEATPAPESDAAPAAPVKPTTEPQATPEPAPTPVPAPVPAPAPVAAPVEPQAVASTPAPAPVVTPQEAPVPVPAAPGEPADSISAAVGNLTDVVERMAMSVQTGLAAVNKKIDDTLGRVDKVERSVLSGGNAEEGDGTEGPIERGGDGAAPSLFHNILHG